MAVETLSPPHEGNVEIAWIGHGYSPVHFHLLKDLANGKFYWVEMEKFSPRASFKSQEDAGNWEIKSPVGTGKGVEY